MSREKSAKRRAVVTGLKPFMSEPLLMQALQHWETHYANSPRFTLQKFVAEIAHENGLQVHRSSMLLSLVKAMHLPESELLPDPVIAAEVAPSNGESIAAATAFGLLMNNLVQRVPPSVHYQFCLDLIASLANPRLSPSLIEALDDWLNKDRPLRVPASPPVVLRALVNRTYVLLCERIGPVEADRLLASVVSSCQRARPDLKQAITYLL